MSDNSSAKKRVPEDELSDLAGELKRVLRTNQKKKPSSTSANKPQTPATSKNTNSNFDLDKVLADLDEVVSEVKQSTFDDPQPRIEEEKPRPASDSKSRRPLRRPNPKLREFKKIESDNESASVKKVEVRDISKLDRLEQELEQMRLQNSTVTTELKQELLSSNKSLGEIRETIKKLEQENETLRNHNNFLEGAIDESEDRVRQMIIGKSGDELSELKQDLVFTKHSLEKNNQIMENLKIAIEKLEKENSELKEEMKQKTTTLNTPIAHNIPVDLSVPTNNEVDDDLDIPTRPTIETVSPPPVPTPTPVSSEGQLLVAVQSREELMMALDAIGTISVKGIMYAADDVKKRVISALDRPGKKLVLDMVPDKDGLREAVARVKANEDTKVGMGEKTPVVDMSGLADTIPNTLGSSSTAPVAPVAPPPVDNTEYAIPVHQDDTTTEQNPTTPSASPVPFANLSPADQQRIREQAQFDAQAALPDHFKMVYDDSGVHHERVVIPGFESIEFSFRGDPVLNTTTGRYEVVLVPHMKGNEALALEVEAEDENGEKYRAKEIIGYASL